MTVFREEFDYIGKAILEPDMLVSLIEGFPRFGISCFSKKLQEAILEKYGGEIISFFPTEDGGVPIYEINYEGERIAFYLSRVGAPAVAMQMEEIFTMGVEKLMVMGSCGTLDSKIEFGHLIIPISGIRDEGTSYHYAPSEKLIKMEPKVIKVISATLEKHGCPYICGKTWTTDGLFRETKKKLEMRKKQGCITVDMEYTAMQAVADFRGIAFGQILYTEDNLGSDIWEERGYVPKHKEKSSILLDILFECVIKI